MCGICGVYQYDRSASPVHEDLILGMSNSLEHRGPDDSGVFLSPDRRIGLGFRRLSIIDLSPAGHQPMSTPDQKVTIVFNGEIYNHAVLRKEFEAKGYVYRSRSDTETILYAYREYGIDFVHKLLGMFSIALWDEEKRQLVVVRDRIGIKPLYYAVAGGQFIFGSEIKAILQHPAVSRELNEEAMYHYLTFLISPAPQTMFKGIFKLAAGNRMVVSADGSIRRDEYWNPVPAGTQPTIDLAGNPVEKSPFMGGNAGAEEGDHIRNIRSLLKQSISDRMMSDVPFGVFLSGGIDSSTNVALMAQLMDRPVDTFSVGFKDLERYNELGYARRIASLFKTNHHEIVIDQSDAFEFLPKLIYHQDEPLADPVCIPLYFVSKLARQHGTIVVQIGEGSDELFAGYSWMARELRFYHTLWKAATAMPGPFRRGMLGVAESVLAPGGRYLALDYIRKAAEGNELFWGGAINFTETHKKHLLNGGHWAQEYDSHTFAREWHNDILRRDPSADYLKRMIYLEFRNRLPELLLMRVDKITMATSVEGRDPFLDHRLVEYVMEIPSRFKIHKNQSKYILKKAVEGLIPNDIIYRKKQGFAAPVTEWLRNEWSGYLRDKIQNTALHKGGYFQQERIKALLDRHIDGKQNHGQALWNLLNLVLWHEQWIEGRG